MSPRRFTLDEKLAEIVREIAMRRDVYKFRVSTRVMRQEEAERRIAIMEEIELDYREVLAAEEDRQLAAAEEELHGQEDNG